MKIANKSFSSVAEMYESAPFPNLPIHSKKELVSIGKNFCKGLGFNPSELKGKKVLVAGCGTGEHALGIALAFKPKEVIGVDLSSASLSVARKNSKKYKVKNVNFIKADIFRLPFKKESFDCVICEGVLPHTSDPEGGFRCLVDVTKRKGIIILGVYSATGRFKQRLFRFIADVFSTDSSSKVAIAKFFYGGKDVGRARIYDSFFNPIIKYYFAGDILSWLEKNNISYIGSYYPLELRRNIDLLVSKLHKKNYSQEVELLNKPGFIDRLSAQLAWLLLNQFMLRVAGRKQ